MSKKHLTLADLKRNGFILSKQDAIELQSHVSRISQHGSDADIVYPGEDEEEGDADDTAANDGKKAKKKETPKDKKDREALEAATAAEQEKYNAAVAEYKTLFGEDPAPDLSIDGLIAANDGKKAETGE